MSEEKLLLITHPNHKVSVRVQESKFLTDEKQVYFLKDNDPTRFNTIDEMSMISEINSIAKWKEVAHKLQVQLEKAENVLEYCMSGINHSDSKSECRACSMQKYFKEKEKEK